MQYVYIYIDGLCVASRLKDHVNDKKKLPILIFPEGKCDRVVRWSYFSHTSLMFVFVSSKINECCFSAVPDGRLATAR